jgi:hypothetical protein
MQPDPRDRPLDALREEAIDRLIVNYGHGRLSQEALERRLDLALEATDHAALLDLTRDLDPEIDPLYLERKRAQQRDADPQRDTEDVQYVVSVFGGTERSGSWTVPQETRVVCIFGGTKIDLSDARLAGRAVRIRLLCLFGGVEIFVPEQVNVSVEAFCIFGGIGNRAPGAVDPAAPRIIIDGLVLFGGAEVKVRKSLRKRLMELAANLRGALGPDAAGPTAH